MRCASSLTLRGPALLGLARTVGRLILMAILLLVPAQASARLAHAGDHFVRVGLGVGILGGSTTGDSDFIGPVGWTFHEAAGLMALGGGGTVSVLLDIQVGYLAWESTALLFALPVGVRLDVVGTETRFLACIGVQQFIGSRIYARALVGVGLGTSFYLSGFILGLGVWQPIGQSARLFFELVLPLTLEIGGAQTEPGFGFAGSLAATAGLDFVF